MTGIIDKKLGNDLYSVNVFGKNKSIWMKGSNILNAKLPIFKKD